MVGGGGRRIVKKSTVVIVIKEMARATTYCHIGPPPILKIGLALIIIIIIFCKKWRNAS